MNWRELKEEKQLSEINRESSEKYVVIFKHSTRCSTSALAINRLEREWQQSEMQSFAPYFLDILNYRSVSNRVAHEYEIEHESPQVLVIKDGNCIYHTSHLGISYAEIRKLNGEISV